MDLNSRLFVLGTLALLFAAPGVRAAGPESPPGTEPEIVFAAETHAAFDRSGRRISHRFLPGGALMAEHHGTLGHVTVARLATDGRLETLCTEHEDVARAWLGGASKGAIRDAELHLSEGQD